MFQMVQGARFTQIIPPLRGGLLREVVQEIAWAIRGTLKGDNKVSGWLKGVRLPRGQKIC